MLQEVELFDRAKTVMQQYAIALDNIGIECGGCEVNVKWPSKSSLEATANLNADSLNIRVKITQYRNNRPDAYVTISGKHKWDSKAYFVGRLPQCPEDIITDILEPYENEVRSERNIMRANLENIEKDKQYVSDDNINLIYSSPAQTAFNTLSELFSEHGVKCVVKEIKIGGAGKYSRFIMNIGLGVPKVDFMVDVIINREGDIEEIWQKGGSAVYFSKTLAGKPSGKNIKESINILIDAYHGAKENKIAELREKIVRLEGILEQIEQTRSCKNIC